jgi:HK97 family phage major capsid protein
MVLMFEISMKFNPTISRGCVSGAFKTLSSTVNPCDDLFTLVSKLKAGYRTNAVFVMNKKTLFAVMGFKDYQRRYVFNPATAPGMQDTLLGYPIVEAEDMPDYTTSGNLAIAFGNFQRGYLIVDRIGTRVIRDPFSLKPYVGFYTTKRLGKRRLNRNCHQRSPVIKFHVNFSLMRFYFGYFVAEFPH